MNFNDEKIIVFKNDAVGDLTQSLKAIKNIANTHKDKIIEIYLSERSEKFNFLINYENVKFKIQLKLRKKGSADEKKLIHKPSKKQTVKLLDKVHKYRQLKNK